MAAGRSFAFAFVVTGLVLGSSAAAQVTYVSQVRTVVANNNSIAAPGFGPFNQTATWSSLFGCAANGQSASATQNSLLGVGPITFSMDVLSRVVTDGVPVHAQMSVSFSVDPGSTFAFFGQGSFGWASFSTATTAHITLAGPGLDLSALPPFGPWQTRAFELSGTLQGGTYSLHADVGSGSGFCNGGSPTVGMGHVDGTLRITPARCRADWDHNGVVQPADVSWFVANWVESVVHGLLTTDFDGNGAVQSADVALFVRAWFAAIVEGPC